MKRIFIALIIAVSLASCNGGKTEFVHTDGTQFILDGKPYYYVGANYWSGPVLASPGEGGDRERLAHDLDVLQSLGVNNLRVLAGADQPGANNRSIIPYLQKDNGELDQDLLVGLDYFMAELGKRGMKAILYFNNDCPWSGGYAYYIRRMTGEEAPSFWGDGYGEFCSQFIRMDECKQLFYDYLSFMISRVNSITGVAYKDDPAIFAWQIANEPRALAPDIHPEFIDFMHRSAEIIRSIDPNHMISSGMEGQQGCEGDVQEYEDVHADPLISYCTFHIWPDNWGFKDLYGDSAEQLQNHIDVARKLGKPLVVEEFGLLRDLVDGERSYDIRTDVSHRNEYYSWLFGKVVESASAGDLLAGANFWAWAGAGRQRDVLWEEGDDLIGDPPFEPQGMFSVYDCDTTTLEIIRNANERILSKENK